VGQVDADLFTVRQVHIRMFGAEKVQDPRPGTFGRKDARILGWFLTPRKRQQRSCQGGLNY
jgi:hypothetical protein